MKKLIALTAFIASVAMSQAYVYYFNISLSGANEEPANTSPALGGEIGGSNMKYDTATKVLTLSLGYGQLANLSWPNLQGNVSSVGIYKNVTGTDPLLFNVTSLNTPGSSKSGFVVGTVNYPSDGSFDADLLAGLHYVNILTATYPGGEIRGALTVVPEPATFASIAGLGLLAFAAYRRFTA